MLTHLPGGVDPAAPDNPAPRPPPAGASEGLF
jgi:hypothetical protein